MKNAKLLNTIKTNNLVVPNILLLNYKALNINEKELLFLSFLMSFDAEVSFDPSYFSNVLGFSIDEIMEMMASLSSKSYVNMIVKKENGKMKEFLDISSFYERLLLLLIDEEENDNNNSLIYEIIEKEFGRTLSPIEYETIGGWLNANISEDLIKEAVREAVLNGVNNLKYIDKILYEWTKKGYKKPSDVKKKKKQDLEEITVFDYDWLDESE